MRNDISAFQIECTNTSAVHRQYVEMSRKIVSVEYNFFLRYIPQIKTAIESVFGESRIEIIPQSCKFNRDQHDLLVIAYHCHQGNFQTRSLTWEQLRQEN